MWVPTPQAVHPLESKAITVLILGVVGIAVCQLTGPFACKMGNDVRNEALAAGWPEPGTNKAGRICGIVATVLLAIAGLFIVLGMIALAVGATASASVTPYHAQASTTTLVL